MVILIGPSLLKVVSYLLTKLPLSRKPMCCTIGSSWCSFNGSPMRKWPGVVSAAMSLESLAIGVRGSELSISSMLTAIFRKLLCFFFKFCMLNGFNNSGHSFI